MLKRKYSGPSTSSIRSSRSFSAVGPYLGAQPGMIAALHTWSQTLVLHPHVHCLVTGGGLTSDGHWRAVRQGFLLPARVVRAVFRGKMLAAIRQAYARGALVLPERIRPQQMLNLLTRLGHPRKTKWNVRIMARYRHGAGVVTYLARYLRGGPIKNARLVACDGEHVTFTWRARQEADGANPSAQFPQAQLTPTPAAPPADQQGQIDALQQQIRDLQRSATMDTPASAGSAPEPQRTQQPS